MICPRCSVAEISPDTNRCVLCGYAAGPQAFVAVDETAPAGAAEPRPEPRIDATAKEELAELFHIERALETAGFVATYVAREAETERKVVVRVLPRQPVREAGLEDRLLRELATAASLDHPHVVPLYRYGATPRFIWYSAKHVPGQSLAELLRASGPLELHASLRVVEQIASALQYAHRRGVVHADVRPSHVRVDPNGWSLLTGFVVGRALDHLPLAVLGGRPLRRPEYLAPEERYSRQPGPAADQFSLAVLVFECLTGSLPFAGMGPDDVVPPALANPRPDMPEHVREALRRALSQRPGERFQSVIEFVSVLEIDPSPSPRNTAALVAGPVPQRQLPAPPRALPPPRRSSPVPGPAPARAASQATPVLLVEQGSSWRAALKWTIIAGVVIAGGVFGPSLIARLRAGRDPGFAAGPDGSPQLVARDSGLTLRADTAPADASALPPITALDTAVEAAVRPAPAAAPTSAPRTAPPAPIRPQPIRPANPAGTPAPGRLFVNSAPWGQLYIDGQLVGNTPQANLVVPAGAHRVRVVRDGFQTFERVVQLAPGQELRLTDITLTALTP
jgi:serine/threonine-protein kinase